MGRIGIGLLLLCAVLPFAATRHAPLVHDDVILRGPGSLAAQPSAPLGLLLRVDLFGTADEPTGQTGFWRPLLLLSHRAELALAGWDQVAATWLGHIVNLVLHAGATLALHRLLRALGAPDGSALVAAALFATHPVHAECVTLLSGRGDLAAMLCGASALALLARGDDGEAATRRAGGRAAGAALLLLAGLLCKESAVLFVALALPVSVLAGRGARRGLAAAGLALLAYALLRGALFHGVFSSSGYAGPQSTAARWWTWLSVQPDMLRLLLLPGPASPVHPVAEVAGWSVTAVLPGVLVLALLGGLALVAWRARARLPAFALLLLLGALLMLAPWKRFPTGFSEVAAPLYERYLYAAVAAPAALVGWWLRGPLERRSWLGALLAVAAAVPLGIASSRAAEAWSSDEAFARAGLAAAPRSANLWNHLGVALLERQRTAAPGEEGQRLGAQALAAFDQALGLQPGHLQAELNRFIVLAMLGRSDEAWIAADRLLQRHADEAAVLENVAQWHAGEKRWLEASRLFIRALETGRARPGTELLLEHCLREAEAAAGAPAPDPPGAGGLAAPEAGAGAPPR